MALNSRETGDSIQPGVDESGRESNASSVSYQSSTRTDRPKAKTRWPLVVGSILFTLIAVFAFFNTQKVTVNLIFTEIDAPLILIILGSVLVGIILAILTSWRHRRRKAKAKIAASNQSGQ